MTDVEDAIDRARAAIDRRAWDEAWTSLAATDQHGRLGAEDLGRLALCSFLTGRDEVAEDAWARAFEAHLDHDEVGPAVRSAFWLGMALITVRGAEARGGGWTARAQRLLEEQGPEDCVEHGYLLLPAALRELDHGDPAVAHAAFARATAIGRRFDDVDVVTLGRLGQGQSLLRMGEEEQGIDLLDEAMVAVDTGRVSPLTTGIVYCAVIIACRQLLDVRRAQQWTEALDSWCSTQSGLVPFRGQCLVHRSELAQLRGDWGAAITEAERACQQLSASGDPALGMAYYQRAELHRLRGEHTSAEDAFERAAALGHDPHPGLARLWLAQGRTGAAVAALRRITAGTTDRYPDVADEVRFPRSRAEVLAAYVDATLAAGDVTAGRTASTELDRFAEEVGTGFLIALAAHARGAVLLAEDRPGAAVDVLAAARSGWVALQAPYEAARTRALLSQALHAVGDHDTAAIELDVAAREFDRVGATVELDRLASVATASEQERSAGLTARELEVVRLVAAGRTNREIADQLVISDKTVARHLHNVFTRLDLPNRSAATAYAYEHDLV